MVVKIPKEFDPDDKDGKSFTSIKTRGVLISAYTARLFRFKSAFLEE